MSQAEAAEAADRLWMAQNSRPCPQCGVNIEKNDGCNHMTCHHCKHDFCWICMGPWSMHGENTGGYFQCNRYEDQQALNTLREEKQSQLEVWASREASSPHPNTHNPYT